MINVILSGALGQMGGAISRLAARRADLKIVAGIDRNAGKTTYGFDVFALGEESGGSVFQNADVLIDFSHPSALDGLLNLAKTRKLPLVMATTGFKKEQIAKITEAAKEIPVFYSSNMSTGVFFFHKLVKMASKELFGCYDIEIVEAHHNQKVDAPSGTAAALFNTIKSVVPDAEAVYERHSKSQKRVGSEVGIHSVRGGGIVGDHQVIFAGGNDCITLSHSAFSRDVFAAGALDAAVFLAGKAAGLYGMDDLLGQ